MVDTMRLEGMEESWMNFFEVLNHLKYPIQRMDGESLGNFWAFVQHLEEQYRLQKASIEMFKEKVEGID